MEINQKFINQNRRNTILALSGSFSGSEMATVYLK